MAAPAFVCLAAYLVGSVPNGLILGKLVWGVDLRAHGSHNIGATNAWRTIGRRAGILIFALDLLKGVFGVWLGAAFAGGPLAPVLGGLFAVAGHSFSAFLRFHGGKGVATGLGAILTLMPLPSLAIFLLWLVIVRATGYVSLGSIVGAACAPLFARLAGEPRETVCFALAAAVFIIVRHRENIRRLLAGTESKIKAARR